MGLRSVRYVTGNNRRRCLGADNHLKRLLAYDAKQPAGSFLTTSQRGALETASAVLEALLSAVRFR
jgi:hypothetical protein